MILRPGPAASSSRGWSARGECARITALLKRCRAQQRRRYAPRARRRVGECGPRGTGVGPLLEAARGCPCRPLRRAPYDLRARPAACAARAGRGALEKLILLIEAVISLRTLLMVGPSPDDARKNPRSAATNAGPCLDGAAADHHHQDDRQQQHHGQRNDHDAHPSVGPTDTGGTRPGTPRSASIVPSTCPPALPRDTSPAGRARAGARRAAAGGRSGARRAAAGRRGGVRRWEVSRRNTRNSLQGRCGSFTEHAQGHEAVATVLRRVSAICGF